MTLVACILVNLVLASAIAYQWTMNRETSEHIVNVQTDITSVQNQISQLRSNLTAGIIASTNLQTSIGALNRTATALLVNISSLQSYIGMEKRTTLVASRTFTVLPPIVEGPYIVPHKTSVINFTAKYPGYLLITDNVTSGEVFVVVTSHFSVCASSPITCGTSFGPTINSYKTTLLPVLPGLVTVELGTNINATYAVSLTIEYVA